MAGYICTRIYELMKTFLIAATTLSILMQSSCGSNGTGEASTANPDAAMQEAACACLKEMDAVVSTLIEEGQKANWEARRWNDELASRTVPCAVRKESHEETLKWITFQQGCPDYASYSSKLAIVSEKLQAFRASEAEPVQDMKAVTGGGGAKELLDQLAGKGGNSGNSGNGSN
jgi:hypothetical protein